MNIKDTRKLEAATRRLKAYVDHSRTQSPAELVQACRAFLYNNAPEMVVQACRDLLNSSTAPKCKCGQTLAMYDLFDGGNDDRHSTMCVDCMALADIAARRVAA